MKDYVQIMKILLIFILHAAFPDIHAQDLTLVSIQQYEKAAGNEQKNQTSLKDFLKEVERHYLVGFSYNEQVIENKFVERQQSFQTNLEDMLHSVLTPLKLRFKKLDDGHYVIKTGKEKKSNVRKIKQKRPSSGPDHAPGKVKRDVNAEKEDQNSLPYARVITGKVTTETGEALPGANILVKGTTLGTVTDTDGNYSLEVPEGTTLIFSYVGYLSEEIEIAGRSVIDVALYADISSLTEVVVIGYGTQKKSDLTGSVSSVKAREIQKLAVPTLDQAIQGRAAGVFVSRNSGAPGAGAEIFIRGVGSIQGSDPLWIIDGVRTSPGSNFNMNDVESVEILKDASAAAIYGASAANGVIIVTTKRGKEGKPKVSFNAYAGVTTPMGLPETLNTEQYALLKNEAYDLAGEERIEVYADPSNLPDVSTDWLDVLYDNGSVQNYDVSVSGGSESANYFISGSYFNETGTYADTWFERYSLRANSDFKLGERIKVGESILLSHTRRDPMNGSRTDWIRATPALPVFEPQNEFGGFGTVDRAAYAYGGGNPLASELRTDELNKNYRFNGNIYFDFQIIEGLNFRANLGGNFNLGNDRKFDDQYFGGGNVRREEASLTQTHDENIRLIGNVLLTYEKQIDKHRFKILGGYEAIRTDIESYNASGMNFSGNLRVLNGADPESTSSSGSRNSDRLLSQFGRINYSYEDKYLLTVNIRRDGNSKFGENNRYGVFPSASIGWRLSSENFMQNVPYISDLKLRASYGILGNSAGLDRYLFEASYTPNVTVYSFGANQDVVQGLRPSRFPNQDIQWEELETYDIGLDLGLIENRLGLTVDYYVKNTNDLLLLVGIPRSAGYLRHAWYDGQLRRGRLNPVVNVGQMQNTGLELAVNYRNKIGKDLVFNISANASYNKNEVKKLDNDEQIVSGSWDGSGSVSLTEVGQPLGYFNGFIVEGIFQSQAEVDQLNNLAPDGVYQSAGTAPGDFKYSDINGDGEITPDDNTFLGNPWPKWIYGLNANINYGNFDLTLFIQGAHRLDRLNSFKSLTHNLFSDYSMTTDALARWTEQNPNNEQPRIILGDPNGNRSTVSSYFVEDGSYLRLKNLVIGYTLPTNLIKSIGKLRIYGSVQNLLTITGYDGFDPEFDRGSNNEKGIDRGGYPQSRTFLFGLQVDI